MLIVYMFGHNYPSKEEDVQKVDDPYWTVHSELTIGFETRDCYAAMQDDNELSFNLVVEGKGRLTIMRTRNN